MSSVRHTAALLAVVGSAALAACGSSTSNDTTAPSINPAGTYILRDVNGTALPAAVRGDFTYRTYALADTLTLRADGTATDAGVYRDTVLATSGIPARTYATRVDYTWTASGSAVTFIGAGGGGAFDATIVDAQTLAVGGNVTGGTVVLHYTK